MDLDLRESWAVRLAGSRNPKSSQEADGGNENMLDILVAGGAGVDTIVRVPEMAFGSGDSLGVEPIRDYVAHTGNGVALGCHHLGLRTRFIDFVGEDPQGGMILRRYAEEGLDFRHLVSPQRSEEHTSELQSRENLVCRL